MFNSTVSTASTLLVVVIPHHMNIIALKIHFDAKNSICYSETELQ